MKPLVAVLAALALGILAGDRLGADPAGLWLAGAVGFGGTAWLLRSRARFAVVGLVCTAVLTGVTVERRALDGLARSPLTAAIDGRADADLVVTLTDDPSGMRFESDALAAVETIDGRDAGGRTVLVTATGDEQSGLRVVEAGDRLRLRGALGPLAGFATRLRWRHAVGVVRVRRLVAVAPASDPAFVVANHARHAVLRGADVLPPTPRALLAGFVLGDTRAIPPDLVTAFRDAGLSHLLAVSGANVAFALAIVEPLLRRARLRTRFLGGIAVLVLFGTMTRWEPSVLRAAVMAALVMLARLLGRPADGPRVLVLAMTALLIVDPFLLHSVGFLLSCGACAGIVLGAAPIAQRLPGPRALRDALGVTTAAQIGVAPVLLTTFGSLPLVALPANLLAAPFVGPLTVWGLVASAVGGMLGPAVGLWLQLPTLAMLRAVELIARTAARSPLALDPAGAGALAGVVVTAAWAHRVRSHHTGRVGRRGRRLRGEGQRPHPA
ncbi:MAG: ComEC/Rec2 family competence protein [Acidimicrobiia bacterium]